MSDFTEALVQVVKEGNFRWYEELLMRIKEEMRKRHPGEEQDPVITLNTTAHLQLFSRHREDRVGKKATVVTASRGESYSIQEGLIIQHGSNIDEQRALCVFVFEERGVQMKTGRPRIKFVFKDTRATSVSLSGIGQQCLLPVGGETLSFLLADSNLLVLKLGHRTVKVQVR